jgi:FKBP-type peptidyl-prolyl cis-trans isomerase
VDFRSDYARGLKDLLLTLTSMQLAERKTMAGAESQNPASVIDRRENTPAVEEPRRLDSSKSETAPRPVNQRRESVAEPLRKGEEDSEPAGEDGGEEKRVQPWMKVAIALCGIAIIGIILYVAFQPHSNQKTGETKRDDVTRPATQAQAGSGEEIKPVAEPMHPQVKQEGRPISNPNKQPSTMQNPLTTAKSEEPKATEHKLPPPLPVADENFVALPSGLRYKILRAGTGPKPLATDTVICVYRGTLTDGSEFDNSNRHGGPAEIPVNAVIKGWWEALQLMPVGSKWRLIIPPNLAYGDKGAGSLIKPNATLIYDVELLSIKDKPD